MTRLLITFLLFSFSLPVFADNIGSDGRYYVLNGSKYLTKDAQSIRGPGQYGRITGKQLFIGMFIRNGFDHEGFAETGGVLSGTSFDVNGSLVAKLSGGVNLAIGLGPTMAGKGDVNIDTNKSYKAIHVSVENWPLMYEEINKIASQSPSGSNIFKKNFRLIDSVVYVTGYSQNTAISFNNEVSANLETPQDYSIAASASVDGNNSSSLRLSDGSAIAYRMRHLCWENRVVVSTALDVVGAGRPIECKQYR